MFDRNSIHEGMVVRSQDGEKLGKVRSLEGDHFIIEKGLIFKDDYSAAYEQILELRDDEIVYAALAGKKAAWGTKPAGTARSSEEVRMPVSEEQLIAEKTSRQAGTVRVKKDVIIEEKQVTVPVTHEEVHVERVPAEGARAAEPGAFKKDEISVPVMEEEVEVKKRPVVREEVRVRKERREEPMTASETVRREEAHVEDDTGRGRRELTREEEEALRAPGLDPDRKLR
jgi:uncharacterized protein (TIGR02271 family)